MDLYCFQLLGLALLLLWQVNYLVLVNIYNQVCFGFREVEKELISCSSEVACTRFKQIKIAKAENRYKLALLMENGERKAILTIA